MKLSPTFKNVDGVWHLTRFSDLKKDDVIKCFNDFYNTQDPNDPVDFSKLRTWRCVSDSYLTCPIDDNQVWGVEVVLANV